MHRSIAIMLLLLTPSAASAATPQQLTAAMEIPDEDIVDRNGMQTSQQADVRLDLGVVEPTNVDMAVMSTGIAAQVQDGVDHDLGGGGIDLTDPGSPVHDQTLLEVTLKVPEGIHSFAFDWFFLSREYPFYVGSEFNDRFTVVQNGLEYSGNIVFDDDESVVDVNNAFFRVVDGESLSGTGFWRASIGTPNDFDGGGTGWVTTHSPVAPGEEVHLRFDTHDVSDGIYDSATLLDNFRWSEEELDDPISAVRPELHYLTPKSGSVSGGEEVLLVGRGFTPNTEVWIGDALVPPDDVTLLEPEALRVVVPASPQGAGLVDVTLQVGEEGELLHGGFAWVTRSTDSAPPELRSVDPVEGEARGGAQVTLEGRGFDETTRVWFGAVEATDLEVVTSHELKVFAPPLEPGAVVLRVGNALGRFEGRPHPWFPRGELVEPGVLSDQVEGCSVGGGGGGLLALLAGLVLLRRRRRGLLLLVLLVGCGSDGQVTQRYFPHPTAHARVLTGAEAEPVDLEPVGERAVMATLGEPVTIDGSQSFAEGASDLSYEWVVTEAPPGGTTELTSLDPDRTQVELRPNVPGTWLVALTVEDERSRRSHPSAVVVEAVPSASLRVLLDWNDAGHDLDLHVIGPGGGYFEEGDCHYANPNPGWGAPDLVSDDPRLGEDVDGGVDQRLQEEFTLSETLSGTYAVLVHHVNDRGQDEATRARVLLWVGGQSRELFLPDRSLRQGEVWRAFTVGMPGGLVNEIDQLTTHALLGGPTINGREAFTGDPPDDEG
jgi:MYXO-CTERM domain-containing protein